MGTLAIHIYGYNNEHDGIVYTVVKDTNVVLHHIFKSLRSAPFTLKHNPGVYRTRTHRCPEPEPALLFWLSTEAVAFSPRPHPYLPCFAPLSRERLSLHCSPN